MSQIVLPAADVVTVLSVAPQPLLSSARPDPAYFAFGSEARKEWVSKSQRLASEEAELLKGAVYVQPEARWGHPIEQILRVARSAQADLIVLGAKGHTNLSLLLLGSVAQGVVQHSTLPVLIARPSERKFSKVLVGYDGSAAAKRGVSFIDRLAVDKSVKTDLVQVIEPFAMPPSTPIAYRRLAMVEAHAINVALRKKAETSLRTMAGRIRAQRPLVEPHVLTGTAAPELIAWAESHQSDLILVGSRKPSATRHYLLGSTAEKLVRHAKASVLVVR
jgi:nucleotide-binding universal stress UspA family protein